ncbi:MAG: hypothetical protein JNJ61_19535 [Anaerolineae bacterium]|nr:hypothetical protein [Anaerolineae bacterium]
MVMVEYEQVAVLAQNLSDLDKIRLIEALMATFRHKLEQETESEPPKARRSSYGTLAGLWEGVSVSAEDIDEARREMWKNFPREDI